jgi:hypothetical protein
MTAFFLEDGRIDVHFPCFAVSAATLNDESPAGTAAFNKIQADFSRALADAGPSPGLGGFVQYQVEITLPRHPKTGEERHQFWNGIFDVCPHSRLSLPDVRAAVVFNVDNQSTANLEAIVTRMRSLTVDSVYEATGTPLPPRLPDGRSSVPVMQIDLRDPRQSAHLCSCAKCAASNSRPAPNINGPHRDPRIRVEVETNLRRQLGERPIPPGTVPDAGYVRAVDRLRLGAAPRSDAQEHAAEAAHARAHTCMGCGAEIDGKLRCSRCVAAAYCSVECQKKMWKFHKKCCTAAK